MWDITQMCTWFLMCESTFVSHISIAIVISTDANMILDMWDHISCGCFKIHTDMWDITHSYQRYDGVDLVNHAHHMNLFHIKGLTERMRNERAIVLYVPWLVDIYDVTRQYAHMTCWYVDMTRDECAIVLYVPWLVDICDVTRQYAYMTRWYVWRDSWWACNCLVRAMTRWYLWRDSLICPHYSLICVTWLVMSVRLSCTCHDSLICVTWLVDVCDVTRSRMKSMTEWMCHVMSVGLPCMYHDSLICVAWLIDVWDMTRHDSFVCWTWLVAMCTMTRWYVWHDSLICVACLVDILTWLVEMQTWLVLSVRLP